MTNSVIHRVRFHFLHHTKLITLESRGNNLFPERNNRNHLSLKYLVKNKMQNGCDKRKRGKINRFKTRNVNCTLGLVEIILTYFCSIWYLNVSLSNYLQNIKKVISTHLKIVHTPRLQFNYSNSLQHWKLNCQHCCTQIQTDEK